MSYMQSIGFRKDVKQKILPPSYLQATQEELVNGDLGN